MTVPYVFHNRSGRVPAAYLDADFAAVEPPVPPDPNAVAQQWLLDQTVRPTGGGVDSFTTISNALYSSFGRGDKGLNNVLHNAFYVGPSDGQRDDIGWGLYQAITGAAMSLNGLWGTGTYTLGTGVKVSLTSAAADFSGLTFNVIGLDASGNTLSEVVTGPTAGATVDSAGKFRRLTSVTPSAGHGADLIAVGLTISPADLRYARSTDGGETWTVSVIDPGLTTGLTRAYQTGLAVSEDGNTVWVMWLQTTLSDGSFRSLVVQSTDAGLTFGAPITIAWTGLTGGDNRAVFYSKWRRLPGGNFIAVNQGGTTGAAYVCRSTETSGFATITAARIIQAAHPNGGVDATITNIDLATNTVTIAGDHTASFATVAGVAVMFGVNGNSSSTNRGIDGWHQVGSVALVAGDTAITTVDDLTSDGGSTSHIDGNASINEWGFGMLNQLDGTLAGRGNAVPSQIPRFRTADGGVTWSYLGEVNGTLGPELGGISFGVDFVQSGDAVAEVITGYFRQNVGTLQYFASLSSDILYSLYDSLHFTPPYNWSEGNSLVANQSGYPTTYPFGTTFVVAYGYATADTVSSEMRASVVQLQPALGGTTFGAAPPTTADNIAKGQEPGSLFFNRASSTLYLNRGTADPLVASWVDPAASFARPRFSSSVWYNNYISGTVSNQLIVENRLTCVLMPATWLPVDIASLGAFMAPGVASTQIIIGAYADTGGTCAAGALLGQTAKITLSATSTLFSAAATFTLDGNPWWMCVIANQNGGGGGMPSIRATTTPGLMNQQIGTSNGNINNWARYLYNDMSPTWGSFVLPSICPAMTIADSTPGGNTPALNFQVA